MHFWTKEGFLEKVIANHKAKGYEVTDRIRQVLEWGGELVEMAYNDGFEDGKKAALADNA